MSNVMIACYMIILFYVYECCDHMIICVECCDRLFYDMILRCNVDREKFHNVCKMLWSPGLLHLLHSIDVVVQGFPLFKLFCLPLFLALIGKI